MFIGRAEHALDSKGRLTIPAKYRAELAAGGVVTRGLGDFLIALPLAEWQKLADRLQDKPMLTDVAVGELRRWLFAEAEPFDLDTQGRFILPAELRSVVGIQGSVTLAGVGPHLELWTPDFWRNRSPHLMQDNDVTSLFRALSV